MKKIILIFLSIILICGAVACAGGIKLEPTPESTPAHTVEVVPETTPESAEPPIQTDLFVPEPGVIKTATYNGLTFKFDGKYSFNENRPSPSLNMIEDGLATVLFNAMDISTLQVEHIEQFLNDAFVVPFEFEDAQDITRSIAGIDAIGKTGIVSLPDSSSRFNCMVFSFIVDTTCYSIRYIGGVNFNDSDKLMEIFYDLLDSMTVE